MTALTLAGRVRRIDDALTGMPHAFGGALALAYYSDPRATVDIDVNVFVAPTEFPSVATRLAALGATTDVPGLQALVEHDGHVRVFWDKTPVDLFFSYGEFHDAASRATRTVPFDGATIEVLSPEHLMVCKVVFNRAKDWVDLDAMLSSGTAIDAAEVLRWVGRIVGDRDARYTRIVEVLTHRSWATA